MSAGLILNEGTHGLILSTNNLNHVCKKVKVKVDPSKHWGLPSTFLREISSMTALKKSPYVVEPLSISVQPNDLKITMPRYQYDLRSYLDRCNNHIDRKTIKS